MRSTAAFSAAWTELRINIQNDLLKAGSTLMNIVHMLLRL
jgi:hypothetical protein